MANPFLFMEEEVLALKDTDNSEFENPFLVEDDDEEIDEVAMIEQGKENPFSASNPFAFTEDDSHIATTTMTASSLFDPDSETQTNASLFLVEEDDDEELQSKPQQQEEEQHDPAMAFFGTTIEENDDVHEETQSKHVKSVLPSQDTQQMISNLTDHLDATSHSLLGKIPVTRSPSPVSMRDLDSPSPGPDVEDLLDGADILTSEVTQQQLETAKPNRPPPPARPIPPRPTPPKLSPTSESRTITTTKETQALSQQKQEDDLLSFGPTQSKKQAPPKPPAPKTKDDILSLYSANTESAPHQQDTPPDLLSEDIDFAQITSVNEEKVYELVSPPEIINSHQNIPTIEMHLTTEDNVMDQYSPEYIEPKEDTQEIEENEMQFDVPVSVEENKFSTQNVVLTPPEQLEKLKFLQERPAEYQAPRPTTPDPIVAQPELAPIFGDISSQTQISPSKVAPPPPVRGGSVLTTVQQSVPQQQLQNHNTNVFSLASDLQHSDEFDDFSAKFETAQIKSTGNAFLDSIGANSPVSTDAWGDTSSVVVSADDGFGNDDGFDSWDPPAVPESTPYMHRKVSRDSDEEQDLKVVIKPKSNAEYATAPALAPPIAKSPYLGANIYAEDSVPRVNPFEQNFEDTTTTASVVRRDSQESGGSGPSTPLFDDDVSQPLEDFPRIYYYGPGWEMQLRQPNKKKITGQRFWKKVFVRLVYQGDNPVVQLLNKDTDKEPFQELPLQGCYSVSEIAAQQFDNFGKIFTVKLQYIFYKERAGIRPGQISKAERITSKFSLFAKYAIDGDYQGVKEFGSDLKKLGLPVEHAPQVSELFKIGSARYEDMKQFSMCIEEALFKLNVHRDRALTYKMEEVQVTVVDEIYVEQSAEGHIEKQIARVRLFFLGFLSGMPDIELGLNDLVRQGKEVVGRHDIIPVATEEWIRLEGVEFHSCVQQAQYEKMRTIKFKPPDACYIELMRFRVRPPKNRELPLQLKATWVVTGNKVQLRADVLVPGFTSRKLGQIPCEDVAIRFPIPECWIYLFRVEKHFRYGSVKSTHRRTGKIKGIERLLGTVDTLQESLIEVTSGQAKYEHHHRAIVWRCPRLPKEGQGAYTTHQLICRLALTSFDQIPDQLAPYAFVEFTMPATQVSHTTCRSVSVQESDSDDPPEKYVRYLARHEYRVGIESTMGDNVNPYLAATTVKSTPTIKEEPKQVTPMAQSDSDSDSN